MAASHTEVKINLIHGRSKIRAVGLNGRMIHGSKDLRITEQYIFFLYVIFVDVKYMKWYLGDPTCSHNLLFVHHLLRPEIFVNITIKDLPIVYSTGCKISAEH